MLNQLNDPVLQLTEVSKSFLGIKALKNVEFLLLKGEVHALCGENGAGKSTLMNVLAGVYQPDGGVIRVEGQPVKIQNPSHAQQLGIGIVHQERSLVNNLNVAENAFANQHPRNYCGLIDSRQLFYQTQQLLDQLELVHITPQTRVNDLSAAQKQMVEIAKALAKKPRILLLDEPTASLTEKEISLLFRLIRSLAKQNISVIYISHRMAEIFEIADRVTILKDGAYQGTHPVKNIRSSDIIRMMVGRELGEHSPSSNIHADRILDVKNLSGQTFSNISFSLCKGEILALSGLVGAGRTEIARTIFGADPKLAGEILVNGIPCHIRHPAHAIAYGIGYVTEERKEQGLFLEMSVKENIIAGKFASLNDTIFLNAAQNTESAPFYQEKLRMATLNIQQKVASLSGGTQQKVVLARWLLLQPKVLIVDEPTHGVDVGAKFEIYQMLRQMANDGMGIVLISSELPEILTLADRILVIYQGTITAEFQRGETTEEEIMHYASGIINQRPS